MPSSGPPVSSPLRDPEAFTRAYRRLAPAARAAAASVLRDRDGADDVVQEVFTAIWRQPEAFAPERGSLAGYVRLMARSRALDRLRSQTSATKALDRTLQESQAGPSGAEPASDVVLRREGGRVLLSVLDGLPANQRAAVLLHHVAGLSDRELADATRVPVGTAKSRIRLGSRRVRRAVEASLAA